MELFGNEMTMDWEEVEKKDLTAEMLKLRKENKVDVKYLVDDKVTKKLKKVVSRNMPVVDLEEEKETMSLISLITF